MEDEKGRSLNSLSAGWNLILEGILERNRNSQVLGESQQAIDQSWSQLNKEFQRVSQYRYRIHRHLEVIQKKMEKLHFRTLMPERFWNSTVEQEILKYEKESHILQIELDSLEQRLKQI